MDDSLKALQDEFQDFAYSVSHDLVGPAHRMAEFSKLLADDYADVLTDEGRLYLSLIMEDGERLQRLMKGLLEYSRLNAMEGAFVAVNGSQAMEQCLQTLQDTIQRKRAIVQYDALPTVLADEQQLVLLFSWLLSNALLFQEEGKVPEITMSASREGAMWRFTVTDNGIGIEEVFHERIFQPLKRLHGDKEYPGIGMGLALARKVVTCHGGMMGVESSLGKGTTFWFTLSAVS